MDNFIFHRPTSVAEAVSLLRDAEDGKLLAGGQSLLPVMKLDMAQPSDVISLAAIDELAAINHSADVLTIGAAATHTAVADSPLVRDAIPALAELAGAIGDPQVRNRGTLGGSVAHADPAADYPAALVALSATIRTDRREIAADQFFMDLFETALEQDELITAVSFPVAKRAAYAKFASPASKYALVGVFVAELTDGVRVAVTGAGPSVFRLPELEASLADGFATSAADGLDIGADDLRSDTDASAAYRAHLVKVMAKRAIAAAR